MTYRETISETESRGRLARSGYAMLRVHGRHCWVQTSEGRPSVTEWGAAVEAYVSGATLKDAAGAIGVSQTGLHRTVSRLGLRRSPRAAQLARSPLSVDVVTQAAGLVRRGANARQAALLLGVEAHEQALRDRLRKRGVRLSRSEGVLRGLRSRRVAKRRLEVQRAVAGGARRADLAARYGVSVGTINNDWRHPDNPYRLG